MKVLFITIGSVYNFNDSGIYTDEGALRNEIASEKVDIEMLLE